MTKNDCARNVAHKFARLRQENQEEAKRRQAEINLRFPEMKAWDDELKAIASQLFSALLNPKTTREDMDRMRDESLRIQDEMRKFLKAHEFPEAYLDPIYRCPLCKDEGAVDGVYCDCYKKAMAEEYLAASGMNELFEDCGQNNDLSLYDEEDSSAMQLLQKKIDAYANDFSPKSENLLFFGIPGCGKTFSTVRIAWKVMQAGHFVLYAPVQTLMDDFEAEQFGKREPKTPTRDYLDAELLIIDDLGTEFSSAFTEAILYQVINTRLTSHKPTVISTNLSEGARTEMYSERLNSRLKYSYLNIKFPDCDLRNRKMVRRFVKK